MADTVVADMAEADMRAAVTAVGTRAAMEVAVMLVEDMWEAVASEAVTLAARIPESVTAGCIQVVFLIPAALILLRLARP